MSRPIPLRVALCVLIGFSLWFSDQAYSEEVLRRSNVEIELGAKTWISQGRTKWSHNASSLDPSLGNPTSELNYKDISSNVVELHGQVSLRNGLFFRGQFGYGGIDDGKLIDDDFLTGQNLISRTQSDIDGSHLWYLNADVGLKVLSFSGGRGSLKAFAGYQYWQETYEAKGIIQLVPPVGTVPTGGRTVITNEVEWNSIRLGLEGGYQITRRFSINGSAAFIPYTSLKNEDIHHFRPDLRQDPSISMRGSGIGANFDLTASYMIVKQLFLDLGYRYWWVQVTDEDLQFRFSNGITSTVNLNEFQTIRHGVTLGLTYKF
ncbi:MAG: hypothetical protein ACREI2_07405 [Nitrospiraceae bacterium]